jgi:DNA-directed RNA polymerase specialized sigma subunit
MGDAFCVYKQSFCSVFCILLDGDLSSREIRILLWKYSNGKSLREIAVLEGVSYQRVDQIVKRGLSKLKKNINIENAYK